MRRVKGVDAARKAFTAARRWDACPAEVYVGAALLGKQGDTAGLLGSFWWYRPGLCQCRLRMANKGLHIGR
jgi:hypothetical protein